MIKLYILLALMLLTATAHAQVVADTARGLVGQEVRLPIRHAGPFDTTGTARLNGAFKLSNPTVFYPERFVAPAGDSVLASSLVRLTDSTYTFSVTMRRASGERPGGDTLVYMAGEALAGYDSICVVQFDYLLADGRPVQPTTGLVITTSIGTPIPYVRHATLEPGYPSPAQRGDHVTFAYRIDKPTEITFHVYDVTGAEVTAKNLGIVPAGIHIESVEVTFAMPSTLYVVRLETGIGEAYQPFFVVK